MWPRYLENTHLKEDKTKLSDWLVFLFAFSGNLKRLYEGMMFYHTKVYILFIITQNSYNETLKKSSAFAAVVDTT